MIELADVIPQVESGVSIRRARVISVAGRTLKVDMGGGIDIPCLDSCNPVPNQWVYIIGEGSSMMAIGAVNGAYKQPALTVTASTATTVTGILNGVSTVVSKAGAYTTTAGDVLPLLYPADASKVWALGPGGVPYVPPPEAPPGGGGGGGGGGVSSGTATYPATGAASFTFSKWYDGIVGGGTGLYFYGSGRFRELQGRTITGFRINLSGGGTGAVYGHAYASQPGGSPSLGFSAGSVSADGWKDLPIGLAGYLISGSGTGGIAAQGGYGNWRNPPYGTLQFDWRK